MIKRLFIDVETSPNVVYSWRIGNKINLGHHNIIHERAIMCVCWKWEGAKRVHYAEWDNGCDKELIKQVWAVLDEADEVIGHNSDRFDVPWINTRAIKHGLKPRARVRYVDTLKMARKMFYFNNNKLDYLAQFLLGDKKAETGGFDLWVDVMRGKKSAMKTMVDYCKKDVILLERVYEKLAQYNDPHTHMGVIDGLARWTCPHCGSAKVHKNKTRVSAKGIKTHEMRCTKCTRYYPLAESQFNAYIDRFNHLENMQEKV